ncbi:hypothetical protein [Cohnella laeviribosi]|uniref:hypothetical protein n=1 Tax=Cohnella laeviribosi TaxID=380174 RepID=UPI0003A5C588|nr:hypothetical protein [Cohnella laeviribosi]
MTQTTPYGLVESWLLSYPLWKSKIEALKIQMEDIPNLAQHFDLAAIHGEGRKKDPVLKTVVNRAEMEKELSKLEKRIRLIDVSFLALTPEEREFMEIRYFSQLASSLTMDRLHLSKRMYYWRRNKILDKVYKAMGGEKCLPEFMDGGETATVAPDLQTC